MQSIKSALRGMAGSNTIERDYKKLLNTLKTDPRLEAFLDAHPHVSDEALTKSLPKVYEYLEGRQHCDECPGLAKCPNLLKGHQPNLVLDKGTLGVTYEPCSLQQNANKRKQQAALIRSLFVPKEALAATFRTIDKQEQGRQDALEAAGTFVRQYIENPSKTKGLFLHGKFGVGKTHIMGAIMNALAERKGVESMMVYTPDFFRELKSSIQERTLDEKLDYIRNVPVLILDDMGAETMTPWVRDEILGSILQRRMMDNLPTLYTSNYDYDELEEHLAYSNKSGTELLKAKRLMERIRPYTVSVALTGKNRRTDQ